MRALNFLAAKMVVFAGAVLFLQASRCRRSPDVEAAIARHSWNETLIKNDIAEIAKTPHPFGSIEQERVRAFLAGRAKSLGYEVTQLPFDAKTPNPVLLNQPSAPSELTITKKGVNVLADRKSGATCKILLGSHYDTKGVSGYLGANDSASSSAALLQVLAFWRTVTEPKCELAAIWFDGEEAQLPQWDDGLTVHPAKIVDNTYGSREFASQLQKCGDKLCLPNQTAEILAIVLLDMVGSPNLSLSEELNSDPELRNLAKSLGKIASIDLTFAPPKAVLDDHIPFRERGIKALNLIDFEHLETWHQPTDDPSRVSADSVLRAAKLASALALTLSLKAQ